MDYNKFMYEKAKKDVYKRQHLITVFFIAVARAHAASAYIIIITYYINTQATVFQ